MLFLFSFVSPFPGHKWAGGLTRYETSLGWVYWCFLIIKLVLGPNYLVLVHTVQQPRRSANRSILANRSNYPPIADVSANDSPICIYINCCVFARDHIEIDSYGYCLLIECPSSTSSGGQMWIALKFRDQEVHSEVIQEVVVRALERSFF